MVAFQLSETRGHDFRKYLLVPVRDPRFDAVLGIQTGQVGPRGGRSKLKIGVYGVQEVANDPERDFPGRRFLIASLTPGGPPRCEDIDVSRPCSEVYEIAIVPRNWIGYCTCVGHRTTGGCKHYDTFYHLVNVVGIDADMNPPPSVRTTLYPCCDDPDCDLCNGTGVVEVEPAGAV